MKLQPSKKLSEAADNLVRVSNLLKAEMSFLSRALEGDLDWRRDAEEIMYSLRGLVRVQISHVDAVCHHLRQMVISLPDDLLGSVFSDSEILRLQDRRADPRIAGKILISRMGTKENINFSFKAFSVVFTCGFKLEKNAGWHQFLLLIKTRDELTHPKSFDAQLINPVQLESLLKVDEWFTGETNRLLNEAKAENPFLGQ